MFIHMTVFGITPGRVFSEIKRKSYLDEEGRFRQPKGLLRWCLLESLDQPGQLVWLSKWETQVDAQAFLTGLDYAEAISALRPYLISGPEWYSYQVLDASPAPKAGE